MQRAWSGNSGVAVDDLTDIPTGPDPLDAAGTSTITATGNAYLDGLIYGVRWAGPLTFSFPTSGSQYESSYGSSEPATNFAVVTTAVRQAASYILTGASNYSSPNAAFHGMGVTQFTNLQISDAGQNGTGDIRIGSSSVPSTAWAYYPAAREGGDVWLGQAYAGTAFDYENPVLGNYAYFTLVHELGHALGLKHGHETGGVGNTAVPADKDSHEFTVMTYHDYVGTPNLYYGIEAGGGPQTFMMLDILALQTMYGANYNYNATDTVYTWSPTTGETFINGVGMGVPGANRVFLTLWDGGGRDTYDMSNYSNGTSIDLTPGKWSVTSAGQLSLLGNNGAPVYSRGNVFNALLYNGNTASLIEDAKGGQGNDTIVGNDADNTLTTFGGNDNLSGGFGRDTLVSGSGTDTMDGGAGRDIAVFAGARSAYTLVHNADGSWTVTGATGTDTLRHVEIARFTDADVSLGYPHRDFDGNGGDDILWRADDGTEYQWHMSGATIVSQGGRALSTAWNALGTGDFDGDGRGDILWRHTDGSVYVWEMNGTAIAGQGTVANVDSSWSVLGIGDFTGDGRDDILWKHAGDGALWLFTMNGTSIVAGGGIANAGGPWSAVDTADLNGDGRSDILWKNGTTGEFYAWTMNGTAIAGQRSLGAETAVAGVTDWSTAGTGDFNGDGTEDILLRSGSTGALRLWDMRADLSHNDLAVSNPGTIWAVAAIGDYNADGRADILWRHATTGEAYLWMMQDNVIAAQASLGNPGSNWHIMA